MSVYMNLHRIEKTEISPVECRSLDPDLRYYFRTLILKSKDGTELVLYLYSDTEDGLVIK